MERNQYGQTAREWLRAQFEYENCQECRRGERSHTAVPFMGNNWFACCNPVKRRAVRP